MVYGLKPSAPSSRAYRVNLSPSNKSVFAPSDTVVINLPTGGRGQFLDNLSSYLKFTVQTTTTAASTANPLGTGVFVENTAYNFIQRLEVQHGGSVLEQINEYGQLCNHLLDSTLSRADKAGLSTMIGANGLYGSVLAGASYAQYGASPIVVAPGDRSGMAMATATTLAAATPYTFCLPLMSGIVGTNASKMLPLYAMNGAPLVLNLTLAANGDAIYAGTAGAGAAWQISNIEFVADIVEIGDGAFLHNPEAPVYISTNTWRHTSTTLLGTTSSNIDVPVGLRAASATQLLARFRPHNNAVQGVNATAAYRKSSSVCPNLSTFAWRIGGDIVPRKPIQFSNGTNSGGGGEAAAEMQRAFHALSAVSGNGSITSEMYNIAQAGAGGFATAFAPVAKNACATHDTSYNAFAISSDLEVFSNKSDVIMSGINTLSMPVYAQMTFQAGATAGADMVMDCFMQMDAIIAIQNGIASVMQ